MYARRYARCQVYHAVQTSVQDAQVNGSVRLHDVQIYCFVQSMHACVQYALANGSSTCMQVLDENRGSGSYMETCPQRLPHICNDPSIMVVLLVNASAKGTVSSLDQLCCDITTVSASQCT